MEDANLDNDIIFREPLLEVDQEYAQEVIPVESENPRRNEENPSNTNSNTKIKKPFFSKRNIFIGVIYTSLISSYFLDLVHCLAISSLDEYRHFVVNSIFIFPLSIIVTLTTAVISSCSKIQMRKRKFYGIVLLLVFCLSKSLLIACLNCYCEGKIVQLILILVLSSLCISAYELGRIKFNAFEYSKFTLLVLVIMMILCFVWFPFLKVIYSTIGVLVYSFYLLIDTEFIISKFRYEITKHDYVYVTLRTFTDMGNIVVFLGKLLVNKNH